MKLLDFLKPKSETSIYPGFTFVRYGSNYKVHTPAGTVYGGSAEEVWAKAAITMNEALNTYIEKTQRNHVAGAAYSRERTH